MLFKNVLVPVDGSENSNRAAEIATAIAKKHGARLFVLHVIPTPAYLYTNPFLEEYVQLADKKAKTIVDDGVSFARSHGVKAFGHTMKYVPSVVEAITEYAVNKKVDLIVIGTRGLSGYKKLLLGSVASGIISHAHCEVLIVR